MKKLITRAALASAMTGIGLLATAATTEAEKTATTTATNATETIVKPAGSQSDEVDLNAPDDSADAKADKPTVTTTEDGLVNVTFENATVASVLQQFRRATRMNILSADSSTNMSRRVSASLSNVPWNDALRSILDLADFKIDNRFGMWFVSEKTAEEVNKMTRHYVLKHASATDLADLFNGMKLETTDRERSALNVSDEKNGQKNDGKSRANKESDEKSAFSKKDLLATAFPDNNILILTGTEMRLNECEKIITQLDHPITQVYIEARFIELSNQAMHKLGLQWDQLKSWGVTAKGIKAGYESNDGKAADYGNGLTQKSLNSNKNVNKSTNTSTSDNDSENSSISAGTSSATASATGSKSDNTSSTESTTDSENSTLTGLFPQSIAEAAGAGASAASMGWRNASTFSGQLSADDFSLALSAFENLQEGRMFSNPRIIVSNGKEATVDMTEKEPNVEIMSSRSGQSGDLDISTHLVEIPGNDKLFSKQVFFSYGISLRVKPRISPTGLISVEVVPTISEKTGDKVISGSGASGAIYTTYPTIAVKTINTEFTMKNGDTAVIGGLTQTTEDDVDSGIPYLRKIPWIGPKIFGWKSREKVQKEILICVTVGIANPETLKKDAGLPTNAVLGREYVEGRRLEPGLRPNAVAEISNVDTRSLEEIREDPYRHKGEKPVKKQDDAREDVDLEADGGGDENIDLEAPAK